MSNTLSNTLFPGTLAFAAAQHTGRNMSAPISIAVYPLLECAVSFVSKNYLPENVRILATFAGAILATDKIMTHFDNQLQDLKAYLNGSFKVNGYGVQAKYVAITSLVLLTLFIK